MPVVVTNRARLNKAQIAELAAEVGGHTALEDVLHWGLSGRLPRRVEEIVRQAEYTHDVLVPLATPLYLVYDVGKSELSSPVIPPEPLQAYELVRDIRLAAPDLVGDREAVPVVIGRKPRGAALAHAGWREGGVLGFTIGSGERQAPRRSASDCC